MKNTTFVIVGICASFFGVISTTFAGNMFERALIHSIVCNSESKKCTVKLDYISSIDELPSYKKVVCYQGNEKMCYKNYSKRLRTFTISNVTPVTVWSENIPTDMTIAQFGQDIQKYKEMPFMIEFTNSKKHSVSAIYTSNNF